MDGDHRVLNDLGTDHIANDKEKNFMFDLLEAVFTTSMS